jgi:hypothetical protein
LLDDVAVACPGGVGRPRKRLDSLAVDKARSSRGNRWALRARRIPRDIPEKNDQKPTGSGKDHAADAGRPSAPHTTSSATPSSG